MRQIEAEAAPSRERVRRMFEAYRPDGNAERDPNAAISESVREKFANCRTGGR